MGLTIVFIEQKKMILIILNLKSRSISNKIMIGYRYYGNKHINPSKYLLYSVEPSFIIFFYSFGVSPILP